MRVQAFTANKDELMQAFLSKPAVEGLISLSDWSDALTDVLVVRFPFLSLKGAQTRIILVWCGVVWCRVVPCGAVSCRRVPLLV